MTPDTVRLGECYTIRVEGGADLTLDLRFSHEGAPRTIRGWPTLDGAGEARACPTEASQLGRYEFTSYKDTQTSDRLPASAVLDVLEALDDTDFTVDTFSYSSRPSTDRPHLPPCRGAKKGGGVQPPLSVVVRISLGFG